MKRPAAIGTILLTLFSAALLESRAKAQGTSPRTSPGTPVRLIVSVEARRGSELPNITMQDVVVNEGHDRQKVTEWTPAVSNQASLELYVLIDDSTGFSVDTQLNELRTFIQQQPPTTFVGLAYIRNGSAEVAQKPTADHAGVAKAVRLPMGNSSGQASPYFALEDLLKRWDANPARPRREVVMITSGIDLYSPGADDPYITDVIERAQRAGVIVYSIYAPGTGHFGHSYWRFNWGQNNLSQVSDETGGEAYNLNIGSAVSFKPFLDDVSVRLGHQFLLTFLAKPEKKAGMQSIKLSTEVPNAELVSADRVYVPASSQP